jgi:acylphosphatase
MDYVRAHVHISGRVQGVNFRAWLRDRAREVQVMGWVRNLSDGRVEAVFEGGRAAVQRMVSQCYSGPIRAEIERVEVAWETPTGNEGTFSIIW